MNLAKKKTCHERYEEQQERLGRDRERGGGWRRESGPAERSRDKGQAPPDEKAGGEVTKP